MGKKLTPWGSGINTGAGALDLVMLDMEIGKEFTIEQIVDEVRRRGLPTRDAVREHLFSREQKGLIEKTSNGWRRISPQTFTIAVEVTLTAKVEFELGAGGFSASIPALSGCHTQGATLEEVTTNIREAAHSWLAVAQETVTSR